MQEGVQWDPQYISHDPGWAVRIYVFYTFFAAIYVGIKSIGMIHALWFRRSRTNGSPEQIAKDALAGTIHENVSTSAVVAHLEYLIANAAADIRAMMRCSATNFISALIALTIGLINTFHGVSDTRAVGIAAISGGISEALTTAAIGFIVGLGAFFLASIFEHRLAHNRAKWNLCYATSPKV